MHKYRPAAIHTALTWRGCSAYRIRADMAHVPMNRAHAFIMCKWPMDYAPRRVHAAACYLEILASA
jgi:hypothetical protein